MTKRCHALSVRGLKAKTVREFERYGTRRIVQHCLDNGQTIYFKETVQDFVWQERARMESGALPHYQWVLTRRAAVYLDQMAKHGKIQGEPLRSWEAEHNGSLTISVQRDFPKKIPWIVSLLLRGWRNEIRKTQQVTEIVLWLYGSLQSTFRPLGQKHI